MDRLKKRGADLVYRCGKGHAEPLPSSKYSGELVLTPLELITRIAQLVPVPACRLVPKDAIAGADADTTGTAVGVAVAVGGPSAAARAEPQVKPKPRPPSHYLWAALIARIYGVFR